MPQTVGCPRAVVSQASRHPPTYVHTLQKQCDQLSVPCSVIALPKSIDNDFLLLDKTFGWAGWVRRVWGWLAAN